MRRTRSCGSRTADRARWAACRSTRPLAGAALCAGTGRVASVDPLVDRRRTPARGPRERPCRRAEGGRRRPPLQDVPASAPALLDAQGAGAASVQLAHVRRAARGRRRLGRHRARRVLRDRRSQRVRARARCSSASPGSTSPTPAACRVDGRLSPFIELGVGFNADLTARDNVLINAVMLGLSRREAQAPLRRDHRVRRARGVHRPQAEELLVGHERPAGASRSRSRSTPTCCSSTRCSRSATRRSSRSASSSSSGSRAAGKTIIFVTHDMGAVERFCDRAMLLERGQDDRARRAARDRAAPTTSSTSAGSCTTSVERRPLRRPGGVRDRRRVVRDAAASG